jgi:hypothetical protein
MAQSTASDETLSKRQLARELVYFPAFAQPTKIAINTMNDRRVAAIREALEVLLDSIDATSRLKRWDASDSFPESMRQSATQLDQRLEAANKLAASSYVGNTLVVSRLNGISDAIRRLDRACTDFRVRIAQDPTQLSAALDAMDAEVDEVKNESERWT